MSSKKSVLLLSGGMDSVTLFAKMLHEGWHVYPVIFDYGQRHRQAENAAAKSVWDYFKRSHPNHVAPFKVIKIDLTQIGNSALTDSKIEVPNTMAEQANTVVPFRNATMLLLAAGYAESLGIYDLFITPVAEDRMCYEDCREYTFKILEAYLSTASKGSKGFYLHTPYIHTWKKDIVAWGLKHQVPYHLSYTCYKGISPCCGVCPACRERREAFAANSVNDPITYAAVPTN